jgi:hypothetical protein
MPIDEKEKNKVELLRRFNIISVKNHQVFSKEEKKKVQILDYIKGGIYFGLIIYFIRLSPTITKGQLNFKSFIPKFIKGFSFYIFFTILLDLQRFRIVYRAFNRQFDGLDETQIKNTLSEYEKDILKIRY